MFFELVTADFVLADISMINANVFYELGVRHGVAERGVLMIHGDGRSVRSMWLRIERLTMRGNCLKQPKKAQLPEQPKK